MKGPVGKSDVVIYLKLFPSENKLCCVMLYISWSDFIPKNNKAGQISMMKIEQINQSLTFTLASGLNY